MAIYLVSQIPPRMLVPNSQMSPDWFHQDKKDLIDSKKRQKQQTTVARKSGKNSSGTTQSRGSLSWWLPSNLRNSISQPCLHIRTPSPSFVQVQSMHSYIHTKPGTSLFKWFLLTGFLQADSVHGEFLGEEKGKNSTECYLSRHSDVIRNSPSKRKKRKKGGGIREKRQTDRPSWLCFRFIKPFFF